MEMETQGYLNQFANEIKSLNNAYREMVSTKSAWLSHVKFLEQNDLPDDAEVETLAVAKQESSNEYQRQELSLRVKSEKTIGKGKPLGDFWTAISKMRGN